MIPRPGYLPLRVGPTFFPASSPPRSPSPTHGPPPLRVVPVARPALLHTGFGWPALGLVSILAGQPSGTPDQLASWPGTSARRRNLRKKDELVFRPHRARYPARWPAPGQWGHPRSGTISHGWGSTAS